MILPGMGGLYGADQGWFPKYVDGIHHFRTVKNMIVTRGLGSDKEKLPRLNNISKESVADYECDKCIFRHIKKCNNTDRM